MIILGINSYHPDSSAAIIVDGKLVAACEEERFRRVKHFAGFPSESIKYCLAEAGAAAGEVDFIAIPRDPAARLLKKALYGARMPRLALARLSGWKKSVSPKSDLARLFRIDKSGIKARPVFVEHHRAHLASSFFTSPFDRAFLFSADALGDFASTVWGIGEGERMTPRGEIGFPHSLGLYYTAITQYLGFLDFGDEYKVMALASYGEPVFEDEFSRMVRCGENGFRLNLDYFRHHREMADMEFENGRPVAGRIFSSYLEKRLGAKRMPADPIEKRHADIAASLQKRLEDAVVFLLNSNSPRDMRNLCLSGGVAFNCAMNGRLFRRTGFKDIYVPPSAGDAGLAIGACLYLWHHILGKARDFRMTHAYWGPSYSEPEIERAIKSRGRELGETGCSVEMTADTAELCRKTAQAIAAGRIVGWYQGRMEWGPRALGNRSILADPRRREVIDVLNRIIKHREPFRPFAPSMLEERSGDYLNGAAASPFMNFVFSVRRDKAGAIAAVCHIDGTTRSHTVGKDENPVYRRLIEEFEKITGVPALLNTSFNDNGPIVCTPEDALDCFLRGRMDILVLGARTMIRR